MRAAVGAEIFSWSKTISSESLCSTHIVRHKYILLGLMLWHLHCLQPRVVSRTQICINMMSRVSAGNIIPWAIFCSKQYGLPWHAAEIETIKEKTKKTGVSWWLSTTSGVCWRVTTQKISRSFRWVFTFWHFFSRQIWRWYWSSWVTETNYMWVNTCSWKYPSLHSSAVSTTRVW